MKTLYNYQQKALGQIIRAIYAIGRALMVMAPGLGKTVVSSFFLKKVYKKGYKVLFLCHDNYILKQAHEEYRKTFDPHGKLIFYDFFGDRKNIKKAKAADVIFASFQSFNNFKSKWYFEFTQDYFDVIIVDEGHHVQAPTFKEVINYFRPSYSLCMTGTPDRSDNLNIRILYGDEVVNITIEEGIAKGWLTPVEYHVLSDGLKKEALKKLFSEVITEKRRMTLNQINKVLFIKKRDEEQIRQIKKYTKDWTKKCIIFCASIHHVRSIAKKLEKGSYVTLYSQNTRKTNDHNLHVFKHGKINIILSVNMFNEGIDVPDAEVIAFLRLTESGVIYRQQLGRGLRKKPGKKKVIVLDFVANAQRILMIQGMLKEIEKYTDPVKNDKSLLSITGNSYTFDFSDDLKNVVEILKVARMGFYPTWQKAQAAAFKLGIDSMETYKALYRQDRQLVSDPHRFYVDFPGWARFFNKRPKRKAVTLYKTWQEASKATIKLGINSVEEYLGDPRRYLEDERLPSQPHNFYADWPGWTIFFGRAKKNFYRTWKEASKAVIKLRIKTFDEYRLRYKEDSRLPSNHNKYKDYPGDRIFFGGKARTPFLTFKKLKSEVKKAKVPSRRSYPEIQKKHKGWPADPRKFYPNEWKGWPDFLGVEEKKLLSYVELKKEVRKLKIKTSYQYFKESFKHKDWTRFPQASWRFAKVWPGWEKFLGVKKPKPLSLAELSKQVKKAGIKSALVYKKDYKKYKDWPCYTHLKRRKGWISWKKFIE